jgi:hypothetical protein
MFTQNKDLEQLKDVLNTAKDNKTAQSINHLVDLCENADSDICRYSLKTDDKLSFTIFNNGISVRRDNSGFCNKEYCTVKLFFGDTLRNVRRYLEAYLAANNEYLPIAQVIEIKRLIKEML